MTTRKTARKTATTKVEAPAAEPYIDSSDLGPTPSGSSEKPKLNAAQTIALGAAMTAAHPPRPFLKWVGGKAKLLAQYEPYLPQGWHRYYEPFLGGGALFFHLHSLQLRTASQPRTSLTARLSDVNPELVNTYCCVRDRCSELIHHLEQHQQQHSEAHYYQTRALHPLDPIERAARFIYLNKTCYNGLYRENTKGHFNVPMGRYRNPGICNREILIAAAAALAQCEIAEASFTQVLERAKGPEDLVYFDPPYHPLSPTSNFTGYSRYAFREAEQRQLQAVCITLAQRGVKVMLSNSDCPFVRSLYQPPVFRLHPIAAARAINSKADSRGKIPELLITSY